LDSVIRFNYLLKADGFNPRISRKVAKTKNSYTLKYDIILLTSAKSRKEEIRFIKQTFYPFLSHQEKLKKFNQLEGGTNQVLKNIEKSQPEVNIGLVGHVDR